MLHNTHHTISVRYPRIGRFFILLIIGVVATSCQHTTKPIKLQGEAQGTYYSIIYYDSQKRNLQPQIDSLLNDFDRTASLWVEESVIRRVNSNQDSLVNPLFYDLFCKSLAIEQATQGAFNCKIGAIISAWGFGFKNREEMTPQRINNLMQHASQSHTTISIDGENYILHKDSTTQIDFNAIAQGYSVDLIAQYFKSLNIHNYLIDVGGEVIGHGTKPNGSPWAVGIERPAKNKDCTPEVEVAINLQDCSVVTSGNYRKYYEQDGKRYSHTIDPATGYPVSHNLLSVSVVSREAWYADAMATAFMVMGLDKSLAYIQQHPDNPDIQAVFFIYDNDGTYQTYATPQFEQLIKQ